MVLTTLASLLLIVCLAQPYGTPSGLSSPRVRSSASPLPVSSDWARHRSTFGQNRRFALRLNGKFVNSIASVERRSLREFLLRSILIGGPVLGALSGDALAVENPPQDILADGTPQTSILETNPDSLISERNQVVANPKAVVAAAALDVHVGSFSDPSELPGLAHFCEHMSFLGNKKYPKEDDFSSFLSAHGGTSNAYTDSEDTVYYFDVNAASLSDTLDRFSQFFVAPLFTASATNRELNAIESEHAKNINSDSFRVYQLSRDSANPAHPLNRFATGNKFTLETNAIANGVDSRALLLEFHRKYYSAGLMTLSVLGKESLDELQSLVASCFDQVPNNNQGDPSSRWIGVVPPYLPQSAASLLEVVPVTQSRSISLSWPLWIRSYDQRKELLRSKPAAVLSHLLGHEGVGSIRSYLSRKCWINAIQAYNSNDITDMQTFDIFVDLTEEGFKHRYDIVSVIFAYMDLIKKRRSTGGIPRYIIDELQTLSQIAFDYAEKPEPSSYVTRLVSNMHDYPDPRQYLTGPQFFTPPSQDQIFEYLDQLSPAAARITVCSPHFKGMTDKIGKYYGTEYSHSTLQSQTQQWTTVTANDYPELRLPRPNNLIPSNFDLISSRAVTEDEKKQRLQAPPLLIRSDDRWELWHKRDESFRQPKIYAIISLAVAAEAYDPQFIVNTKLFIGCFEDSITEFLYEAGLAGLRFNIEVNSKGFSLVFSGFSDKISVFAEQTCKYLTEFIPNMETYVRMKSLIDRELQNWGTEQPYYHSSYYASLASESLQYPIGELQKALQSSSINQLDAFLKKSLRRSYGKALVVGNIDKRGAQQLTNIVQSIFAFRPLPTDERSSKQVALIPLSSSIEADHSYKGCRIARPEPNTNDDNSATTFYFQIPSSSPDEYMYVELLAEVLEQPFYNSLRTKQQLGYIVFSGLKVGEKVRYLTFVVQSSTVNGRELTSRVEDFLRVDLRDLLRELTDSELAVFKSGIAVRKLEPDQRLTTQANRFWTEITMNNSPLKAPVFDRAEMEVRSLQAISLEGLRRFAEDLLSIDGTTHRLLVSEITSPAKMTTTDNKAAVSSLSPRNMSSDYYDITDEVAFKQRCGYI